MSPLGHTLLLFDRPMKEKLTGIYINWVVLSPVRENPPQDESFVSFYISMREPHEFIVTFPSGILFKTDVCRNLLLMFA